MKRIKKVITVTVIVLFSLINISFAQTGKINSTTVRVREKASTSSNIITNVYRDDSVEIIDTEGDWYKVKISDKTGYIKSDYITVDTNSDSNSTLAGSNENFSTNTNIKVRSLPSMISTTIGSVEAGKAINKLDEINNWTKITDGSVTGWVLTSKIGSNTDNNVAEGKVETPKQEQETKEDEKVGEKTTQSNNINKIAIVNVKTARVRGSASTTGDIIDLLDYNDEVKIIGEDGKWYKISYNGKEGYIDNSLVTLKDAQGVSSRSLTEERQLRTTTVQEKNNNTTIEENEVQEQPAEKEETKAQVESEVKKEPVSNGIVPAQSSGSGQDVVNFAMQFIGYPYVSAGKKPSTGFDCSGFSQYVFSNFGVSLGGSAASQIGAGREVSRAELIAGDLLIFYNEGKTKVGHTGIYIGNGDFVHAANPNRGVTTDNLNTSSYYNERYITARRIVE